LTIGHISALYIGKYLQEWEEQNSVGSNFVSFFIPRTITVLECTVAMVRCLGLCFQLYNN
jgi:hypothetical protein